MWLSTSLRRGYRSKTPAAKRRTKFTAVSAYQPNRHALRASEATGGMLALRTRSKGCSTSKVGWRLSTSSFCAVQQGRELGSIEAGAAVEVAVDEGADEAVLLNTPFQLGSCGRCRALGPPQSRQGAEVERLGLWAGCSIALTQIM